MENDRLYLSLKNRLCAMIYTGIYKEGENIPPERVLAERLELSRVTVRKALDLLEKDQIIERVQGSGTQIKLRKKGYRGNLDLIALVAPAQNPFFAAFIDSFQKEANQHDSLVLFMQNPAEERIEDSLFKLFQKNIRNVVIWLESLQIDKEKIRRLRGLGMNIVFFDISVPSPYGDCVALDNEDAVDALYKFVKEQGIHKIYYIGWDNHNLSSVREREETYKKLSQNKYHIFHMNWDNKGRLTESIEQFISVCGFKDDTQQAVICGDGELGIALKKALIMQRLEGITVVSVDDYPEAKELGLSVYKQCFPKLAKQVYCCLAEQNNGDADWKALVYKVKGEFIRR